MSCALLIGAFGLAGSLVSSSAEARKVAGAARPSEPPPPPFGAGSFFGDSIARSSRFRLSSDGLNGLLDGFARPEQKEPPPFAGFWRGRYGFASFRFRHELAWSAAEAQNDDASEPPAPEREPAGAPDPLALGLDPFELAREPGIRGVDPLPVYALEIAPRPEPDLAALTAVAPCPAWQRRRPVTLMRWGGEQDSFRLIECDGSVADEALDRLSVIARPPGVERPELPLPLEAASGVAPGEWLPSVRMVHPRLVWLTQTIADAFPYHALYVVSGYRPGDHASAHKRGRALDLLVVGVPNETVLAYCRKLQDVGCGYYPNNRFVHVDVRPARSGHPFWIDTARPGEPSHYVDSWPGVVENGEIVSDTEG